MQPPDEPGRPKMSGFPHSCLSQTVSSPATPHALRASLNVESALVGLVWGFGVWEFRVWGFLALRASQSRVSREPTGRAIIVIVIEQGKREPTRERVRERQCDERERKRKSETARDAPACTFNTLPCVLSKRPCLKNDTGMLTAHTGAF